MKIKNEHIINEIETTYDSNGAIATERILCLCGEEFDDKDEFNEHLKKRINIHINQVQHTHRFVYKDIITETYFCKCGKEFESASNLNEHLELEVI